MPYPGSTTSLIDSRGNDACDSGNGSTRRLGSRFSFLSAAKLNGMLGSMSELPVNLEDGEGEDVISKTWCFG